MKTLFFSVLLLVTQTLIAQVIGKTFPNMVAETIGNLTTGEGGKKVNLPTDTKGKYTLLGLAYSKKSEEELNSWFTPVFEKFIQKTTGLMAGMGYDVNVYFIPMFTGINTAASGTAKKHAAKNIDPQLLPYVLFYKGELKPYKDALDFQHKDVPYFFVLNAEGKIIYATSGKYSDDKMDEIESVIE